jgi:protein involved in ribonucleotide reduction
MKLTCQRFALTAGLIAFCVISARGEIADAVYRDGAFFGMSYHAALKYRYDNGSVVYYVIHSAGGQPYEANSVKVGTWADFLNGNNFVGWKCPANLSKGVRDSIINDALDQLNAHYWNWPFGCYETPNSSPGSGDGCFRCDFLVEWCYEQNGYDICNDAALLLNGPPYQMNRMSDAVQTPPYNVAMTYPSSTDVNNPTISHSSSITLQASASDAHSGLSYNKPFDYYYSKYINGSWTSWQFLRSDWGSTAVTILSADTWYAWYVVAYDNDGNSTVSSVYYFKWVPQYTISTSSSPSGGGTTSGGGTYDSGTSVTVCATPNSCYYFVNWTESGNVVSTSSCYTFTASGNRNLVANFSLRTYTISTSGSPSGGGSTSGGGTYNCGASVQVCATPNLCYNFVNWTESGNAVSSSSCYTFTAGGNRSLVANFSQKTYTISASGSPSGGGSTTGSGTYNCGASVTVCASPNSCYTFVNWTENGTVVSSSSCYAFTASGNRNLVANFAKITYVIGASSSPSGGGSTSGGGTCNCGDSVQVCATPNSCYTFVNWTENGTVVSSSSCYTFTASGNRNLVANFAKITYAISTSSSPSGGGSTSGGGTYNCGDSCTVHATPSSCNHFVSWTEGSTVVSTSADYSFSVSGPRSLVANFAVNTYTTNTSSSPTGGGSTSGGGTYNCGDSVQVCATPNSCFDFVNWTENGNPVSTSSCYTFTASGNRNLVANLSLKTCTVNTSGSPSGGGSTSGGGTYNCGASVTVCASPNSCYNFVNWTENGNVVSSSSCYTFTASGNRNLVANFAKITYAISTSSSPSGGGSTSGSGTYNCGDSVQVCATPNSCYTFVNWTENGTVVSSSSCYTFTASGNRNLVANFAKITYAISTSSSPSGGGSTSGGGTYNCGDSCTVHATPSSCNHFVSWTEGSTVVSTSADYSFSVSGPRSLVANFAVNTYTINTSSSPTGGGSTSGGGTYNCGDSVQVCATPNSCYNFVNWTENGNPVSTSSCYTFTASGNRNLVANFAKITYAISTSSSPSGGGSTSGGGTYNCGDSVQVCATPNSCYNFVNWTENGNVVSSSSCYTFTASGNRNLVANFAKITYAISTSGLPSDGGATSGGGTYNCGDSVQVCATPNSCYNFVNWTENGNSVSTSSCYTFTASGNRNLVANFALKTFTVAASASSNGSVNPSGSLTKNCGDNQAFTATPNGGYAVEKWLVDGTPVQTGGRTYTLPSIHANHSVSVAFGINHPPVITSGPVVTNAPLQVANGAIVAAGETSTLAVGATDPDGDPLSYQWNFGDGATGDSLTTNFATHAYAPTNCGPYTAGVTVTDGQAPVSSNLTVTVACQLNVTKLQGTLNFAKTNADSCTVKGTFNLPADYSFSNKLATLDIGGTNVSFTLSSKGSGQNGLNAFKKPTYNKKTGLWTFSATLKNGSWQTAWAEYGMVNTNTPKQGILVTNFPVILVVGDEAFMGTKTNLHYTAKWNKSGTAK